MSRTKIVPLAIALLVIAGSSSTAFAQYTSGYHVDPHGDDSHGHDGHYVPHYNSNYSGSYYSQRGSYYYVPQHGQAAARPVSMQFGGFSHVDDLAARLESLTNELCLDLHYNYSHNHGFRITYAEAYEILQVARFIHEAEHNHQDRDAIAAKLGGLDSLFHHVEDDVRGWSRHHHRQIGNLGILTKMEYIESTIHHLMNDVGVRASGGPEQAPAPRRGGREQAPVPLQSGPPRGT